MSILSRIVHRRHADESELDDTRPWWESLSPTFASDPEEFELGFRDRARVGLTAGLDFGIRTAGACLVGALAGPGGYNPSRLREMAADRDFYSAFARGADPHAFFTPPPAGAAVVTRHPVRGPAFRAKHGLCEDLRFPSRYVPRNPRLRAAYRALRGGNGTAHARYWRHHDGPRPTIVAIHGFSADLSLLNEWFFALPWFYKMGCDVLLFTLPFHGARQNRFSPFSGHGFFAGGVSRINEAFGQAVYVFRALLDWLGEQHGVRDVGLTGVSLGGYTSALLATLEPRLRLVIPNVPLVSLADLVLEWHPISALVWLASRTLGVSVVDLREMLAVHSPLTYKPILPRERLFIVGGVGDRLAPPKHSRLLWEHWARCRIHWFPGSHLIHLDKGQYLRQIRDFMQAARFI